MPHDIRTFKAATVEDALAQIRREMGFDVAIVETKQIVRRSLLPWVRARQQVEIKATRTATPRRAAAESQAAKGSTLATELVATQGNAPAANNAVQRSSTHQARTRASSTQTARSQSSKAVLLADLAPPPPLLDQPTSPTNRRTLGKSLSESRAVDAPAEPRASTTHGSAGASPSQAVGRHTAPRGGQARHDAAVRQEPLAVEPQSSRISFEHAITAPEAASVSQSTPSDIEQRLDSLQQMIAELGRRTRPRGLVEIPPELFAHYLTLIEADVDDEIARDLIARLQQHAAPEQLEDTASVTALLTALIERDLRCEEPLTPKRGCRQVAMLVGPTGVGKTTTIAKLAGRFGVTDGLRVGLITVDTYRVAAVDQLRTYADIIGLPMHVVSSPEELPTALALFANFDLVLIDTAGRSPQDDRRMDELKQLVEAANPDHVYLVLSLAAGAKSLRSTAERFATARPTSLILTKLDEAAGCGGVLTASRDIVLPISYLTAGQEVPRDIEPVNACRAARLVLGRDKLNQTQLPCPLAPALRGEG